MKLKTVMKGMTITAFGLALVSGLDIALFALAGKSLFNDFFITGAFAFLTLMFCATTLIATYEMHYVPECKKKWCKKWLG